MLAERHRREREEIETGHRVEEERTRLRQDKIFKAIVNVHQETVDSYLEDIILGAQSAAADELARQEIRAKV